MPTPRCSPLIALVAALALVPAAHASTLCVGVPSGVTCDETRPDVVAALTAAADAAHQGDTTVAIGPGTYTGPFAYNGSGDPAGAITIRGAGAGATTLTASHGAAVLNVTNGGPHHVSELHIAMGGAADNTGPYWGIVAAGTIDHVTVDVATGAAGNTRYGLSLSAPPSGTAAVTDTTISLPAPYDQGVVAPLNGGLAIADTAISAATGVVAGGGSSTWTYALDRVRIAATRTGIDLDGRGDLALRDALVDLGAAPTAVGLSVYADGSFPGTPATLAADRVTVVGTPGAGQVGVRVMADAPQATSFTASATLRSSVVWGVDHPYTRDSDGTSVSKGTASLVTDYVADDGTAPEETHGTYGLGGVQVSHQLAVSDPGFVGGGDWHLAPASPLVDAGDPAVLPAGTLDLDRVARPQHDRVDIGAFEWHAAPPPAGPGDGDPPPGGTPEGNTGDTRGTGGDPGTPPAGGPTAGPGTPGTPPGGGDAGAHAPRAADVIALPAASRCVSRRLVVLHLRAPKGDRLVRAVVTVAGRRTVLRGRSLTGIPVRLRGLPRGRWTVRVAVRLASGRSLTLKRRYRTCAKRRVVTPVKPRRPR